jgi:predicted acetyltransferase
MHKLVSVEPAPITRDEVREFAVGVWRAFHGELRQHRQDAWAELLEPERTLAFRDDGRIVAGGSIFSRYLTVPGGEVPVAGVTLVGVQASHRRRGILTMLMERQLADVHEQGREAIAALWASEPVIYGRFGYGLGTTAARLTVNRVLAELRRPSTAPVRMLEPAEALPELEALFEEVRPTVPGMLDRRGPWWAAHTEDHPDDREGAEPMRAAVADGAYALYSVKMRWADEGPASEVVLHEALATDADAEAAIWSYLLGLDLTGTITWEVAPVDHPLIHMVRNAVHVRTGVGAGLFVRVVDVPRALTDRTYGEPFELVFELEDATCPWNAGRWALRWDGTTATCARTATPAGIELTAEELGAAYLGGTTLETLARAGRVRELRAGALAPASRSFRADRAPWCQEIF